MKLAGKRFVVAFSLFIETILISMLSTFNIFDNELALTDSAVYKYIGYAMKRGLVPYKDIFDHKGPLLYLYNYFGTLISNWRGIWIIEILSMAVAIFFMYKIARLMLDEYSAVLLTFVANTFLYNFFAGGNNVEEYALPFIAIAIFIFADFFINDKITKIRLLACGCCFAGVLFLRVNMVGIWVVFCLAVLVKTIREKKAKQLIEFLIFFIIGVLILAIPIFMWLGYNNAIEDFIVDYIVFNLKYSSCTVSEKINATVFFLFQALVLCSVVAMGFAIKKEKRYFDIVYLVALAFVVYTIAISGRTYAHYAIILTPVFMYPLARLWKLIEKENSKSVILIGCLLIGLILPTWKNLISDSIDLYANRAVDSKPESIYAIIEGIDKYTSYEDRIVVYGNNCNIYVLSDRLAASKYAYQYPISKIDNEIYDEFIREIEEALPKAIVRPEEWKSMDEIIQKYNYVKVSESEELGLAVYIRK